MAVAATLEKIQETITVPEMAVDHEVRLRAGRFIGAVMLNATTEVESCAVEKPIESLHDAIHRVAEGDEMARNMVRTNVATDIIERTIKTGHVMRKTPLVINNDGTIVQYGQAMTTIQANSLRHAAEDPIMRSRTEAEVRNAFRIEQLHKLGLFDAYSFVVFSRAEDLPEAGFFTDTMSASIQLTGKRSAGLSLESAFVSGKARPSAVQHDEQTVVRLGALLGTDYSGKTPAQIIDTPLLIHNSLIPNGVIDLVKLYDQAAGGLFFGEARDTQDYLDYLQHCHEREDSLAPVVTTVTNELIAAADNIKSPMDAVCLLNDLSEFHMVHQAVGDLSIDARVFGYDSMVIIQQAREAYAQARPTQQP